MQSDCAFNAQEQHNSIRNALQILQGSGVRGDSSISILGNQIYAVRLFVGETLNGASNANALLRRALATAFDSILVEYVALLAKLEDSLKTGTLSLLSLYKAAVYPYSAVFECIEKLLVMIAKQSSSFQVLQTAFEFKQQCRGNGILFVQLTNIFSVLFTTYMKYTLLPWLQQAKLPESGEFFVVQSEAQSDCWLEAFSLVPERIPAFFPFDCSDKILQIGRSVKLAKDLSLADCSKFSIDLPQLVDEVFLSRTLPLRIFSFESLLGSEVCREFLKLFPLADHLRALRSFVLLGRGDFSSLLMSKLFSILEKRSSSIFKHALISEVDNCLKACNCPLFAIEHLDVRLCGDTHSDEEGWDLISLDYRVDGPLLVLFPSDVSSLYRRSFRILWLVTRAYHCLLEYRSTSPSYRSLFNFCSSLLRHLHTAVIDVHFKLFIDTLSKTESTLESLLLEHRSCATKIYQSLSLILPTDSTLSESFISLLTKIYKERSNYDASIGEVSKHLDSFISRLKAYPVFDSLFLAITS